MGRHLKIFQSMVTKGIALGMLLVGILWSKIDMFRKEMPLSRSNRIHIRFLNSDSKLSLVPNFSQILKKMLRFKY